MAFIGNQPTAVPLTSSQLADGLITSAKIADGAVVNVDVNSTAAIAYSKLNLTTSIVNGDIANATIALAKLSATGTPSASTFLRGDNSWASAGATAGQVIQVVSTSKTNTFSVSTNTFTDVTDLSVSITPSSASNKILVLCYMNGASNQAVGSIVTRLVRDSTAISVGDASGSRIQGSSDQTVADSNHQSNMNIMFLDSPASTSATTYKIQIRGDGASSHQVSINRSQGDVDSNNCTRTASSITVMEIKG